VRVSIQACALDKTPISLTTLYCGFAVWYMPDICYVLIFLYVKIQFCVIIDAHKIPDNAYPLGYKHI